MPHSREERLPMHTTVVCLNSKYEVWACTTDLHIIVHSTAHNLLLLTFGTERGPSVDAFQFIAVICKIKSIDYPLPG